SKMVSTVEPTKNKITFTPEKQYAIPLHRGLMQPLRPYTIQQNAYEAKEQQNRMVSVTGLITVNRTGLGQIGCVPTDKMFHAENNPEMAAELDESFLYAGAFDTKGEVLINSKGLYD